jgi:hypothetical protein
MEGGCAAAIVKTGDAARMFRSAPGETLIAHVQRKLARKTRLRRRI